MNPRAIRATDFDLSNDTDFAHWKVKYGQQLADDLGAISTAALATKDPARVREMASVLTRYARNFQEFANQLNYLADQVK